MTEAAVRGRRLTVVPDALDLRDRQYQPSLQSIPTKIDDRGQPAWAAKVRDQGQTSACTGFALSAVIEHLLRTSQREPNPRVSPYMLYHNARKYDEFPGAGDTGSSLRGCLKGWHKHGVCHEDLWKNMKRPRLPDKPEYDWWRDGVMRPLGAYYRIDVRSIADMHVAIAEVGAILASAVCHSGWDEGFDLARMSSKKRKDWSIPPVVASEDDAGHAFAIIGYDDAGFLILNSWGKKWGDGGYARLEYRDWLDNAMDCWVAQLGVPTPEREAVAQSTSLRTVKKGKGIRVELAASPTVRIQELSPFIINVENDGRLSDSGQFHTDDEDLDDLVHHHLDAARARWGIPANGVADVAIYAHGGLTAEEDAAKTAAKWIPKLYENRIFPVFLMWETGLFQTLRFMAQEWLAELRGDVWNWWTGDAGAARPTGALGDQMREFLDRRVERALARPGTAVWDEMKENARLISDNATKQGFLKALCTAMATLDKTKLRLHVVAHSAGSIATLRIVSKMVGHGWKFETAQFLAPAATVDLFARELLPHIASGDVNRYTQFHLDDHEERTDKTARFAAGYGKSLLYLVANSFEGGARTAISGLQVDFDRSARINAVRSNVGSRFDVVVAPRHTGPARSRSGATVHGAFDDDPATMEAVIQRIKA